jgi:hypothetical protein
VITLWKAHRIELCGVAEPSLDQFVTYPDENLPERDPRELL